MYLTTSWVHIPVHNNINTSLIHMVEHLMSCLFHWAIFVIQNESVCVSMVLCLKVGVLCCGLKSFLLFGLIYCCSFQSRQAGCWFAELSLTTGAVVWADVFGAITLPGSKSYHYPVKNSQMLLAVDTSSSTLTHLREKKRRKKTWLCTLCWINECIIIVSNLSVSFITLGNTLLP